MAGRLRLWLQDGRQVDVDITDEGTPEEVMKGIQNSKALWLEIPNGPASVRIESIIMMEVIGGRAAGSA
jgi:hypothetical protein